MRQLLLCWIWNNQFVGFINCSICWILKHIFINLLVDKVCQWDMKAACHQEWHLLNVKSWSKVLNTCDWFLKVNPRFIISSDNSSLRHGAPLYRISYSNSYLYSFIFENLNSICIRSFLRIRIVFVFGHFLKLNRICIRIWLSKQYSLTSDTGCLKKVSLAMFVGLENS